jgi:hypothetical protein
MGRPRRRWEDNIKMDLREIGIDGASWIRLAQDSFQWKEPKLKMRGAIPPPPLSVASLWRVVIDETLKQLYVYYKNYFFP